MYILRDIRFAKFTVSRNSLENEKNFNLWFSVQLYPFYYHRFFIFYLFYIFITINETLLTNVSLKIKKYKIKRIDYDYFSKMNNCNCHRAAALHRYNAWILVFIYPNKRKKADPAFCKTRLIDMTLLHIVYSYRSLNKSSENNKLLNQLIKTPPWLVETYSYWVF